MDLTAQLEKALKEQGFQLTPINRDKYSIKDEPKWQITKID